MIEVKNITKYFGEDKVLDSVNFSIGKGEICGFIGKNGAGKSTTMRILCGLILDYQGEVFIKGKKLSENMRETKQIIGFMPDQYGLYDEMGLGDYLDFFRISYGLKSDKKKIKKVLKQVSLFDKIDDSIGNLSRGMTQRICLARALITEPEILILDEPASGLDPKLRIELKNLLLELKKKGVTIFVSSHILNELGEYCDSIIFIEKGKIKKQGNIADLHHSKQKTKEKKYLEFSSKDYKSAIKLLEDNNISFKQKNISSQNSSLEEIYLEVMD